MPKYLTAEGEEPPTLQLRIGFIGHPDSREAGRIIERLGNAFSQLMRLPGRSAQRLIVTKIEINSLIANFQAFFDGGAAALTLIEHRQLLTDFVGRIAVGVQIALDASGGGMPPSIRSFLQALAGPVAAGRATEAKISIVGDNNVVIVLERPDAATVQAFLTNPVLEDTSSRTYAAVRRAAEFDPAVAQEISAQVLRPPLLDNMSARLTTRQVERPFSGSLHWFIDNWYLRPAGHDGRMFPAKNIPPEIARGLDQSLRYIVEGSEGGTPASPTFAINRAEPDRHEPRAG